MKSIWWKVSKVGGPLLLLVVASGCQPNSQSESRTKQQQRREAFDSSDARAALEQKRYDEALRISLALLQEQPNSVPLLMVAGESSTKLEKYDEAIDFYRRIPDSALPDSATARWAVGEIHFHLNQPSACIAALEECLRLNPNLIDAHERLSWVLGVCGRRSEMLPHLMALLKADRTTLEILIDLGNPVTDYQDWGTIELLRQSSPDDLLPNLVLAERHHQHGEIKQAEELLVALLKQQPELVAAHNQLGRLWLTTTPEKLVIWHAGLPKSAEDVAETWCLRGEWLSQMGKPREAIHCFLQTIRRDPNHSLGYAVLTKALKQAGETSSVAMLQKRLKAIHDLNLTVDRIRRNSNYEPTIRQAAEFSYQLGRYWEAIGWCHYGTQLNAKATWHVSLMNEIEGLGVLSLRLPHTYRSPELKTFLATVDSYPAPVFPEALAANDLVERAEAPSAEPARDTNELPAIRFEEIAARSGVSFVYRNSFVDRAAGKRMFEVMGAGVGAMDYDRDGRPDLFVAQGTPWPIPATGPVPSDSLYRNLGVGPDGCVAFVEATGSARIEERQFGQGVCVADIDADGFDDVYVANFGENQLWINQGDGTFQDSNSLFASMTNDWTVSALAADLDGNGLVELYDVNYVVGDNVATLRCTIGGLPRACPPLVFSPAPQRLWIANDQGKLSPYDWAPQQPISCNGLGAVAFRQSVDQMPSIFVSVDQLANVLLHVRRDPKQANGFALDEEGLLTGIAFDHAGKAQACMGIATGDVDHNGEVDFLVTNFLDESNTLYLQHGGLFSDATLKTGLAGPSRKMLGFGTQMLDANLDGELDIAVLNGHIDDHSHLGIAEKMRPQFFLNRGKAKFTELPELQVGPFFGKKALGRALAMADFNSDGRMDLVATDLEAPLAILENRSDIKGEFVAVELVGVASDRNAFLTRVTLTAADYRSSQQLIAGSGYEASNQRMLLFAVPKGTPTVSLSIQWPSGLVEEIADVSVNGRIALIEGLVGR